MQAVGYYLYWYTPVRFLYAHEPTETQELCSTIAEPVTAPELLTKHQQAPTIIDTQLEATTFETHRLNRPLTVHYERCRVLLKSYQSIMARIDEKPRSSELIEQVEQLYVDCVELQQDYLAYQLTYPDEVEWLRESTSLLESPSDEAYVRIHLDIVTIPLRAMIMLCCSFDLSFNILNGLCSRTNGYLNPPPSKISQKLSGISFDDFMLLQLKMFEIGLVTLANLIDRENLTGMSQSFAQFMEEVGGLIEIVGRERKWNVEHMFDKSREFLSKTSFVNTVHYIMMEHVLKNNDAKMYQYLTTSLCFSMYLLHPQTVCALLYYLNNIHTAPNEKIRPLLVSMVTFFVKRVIPPHLALEDKDLKLTSIIASALWLRKNGWLRDYVQQSDAVELYELLDKLQSTLNPAFILEPLAKPTLPHEVHICFVEEPKPSVEPKQQRTTEQRTVVVECLKLAMSIPAFPSLSQEQKGLPRGRKCYTGELQSLVASAVRIHAQFLPCTDPSLPSRVPDSQIEKCEQLLKEYGKYLQKIQTNLSV
ncbi:MAG: hypothetical protein ACPGUD_06255 [Parashewanella sp.]